MSDFFYDEQYLLHYACQYGDVYAVNFLLNKLCFNPRLRDSARRQEPLDYALDNDHANVTGYLCKKCISSDEMLQTWRKETTLNLVKHIIEHNPFDPNWKTASGDNILPLVWNLYYNDIRKLNPCISKAVVLREIRENGITEDQAKLIIPSWRTADGDSFLEVVCQSEICLAQITSPILQKWLRDTIVTNVRISIPDSKTADGKTLIGLICHSEMYLSQISSTVLLRWLTKTTLDLTKLIVPWWKTADGDTLLKLVCQSEICLSQISSLLLLKWLYLTNIQHVNVSIPDSKTVDSDTLLQLACQSEKIVLQISSAVFSKWLSDTNHHVNFITPDWKTADGDTLLQLVCQSDTCLSRVSSELLLKWIYITTLNFVSISLPDSKTADGDTLLGLICELKTTVSRISSTVLSKFLKDTTINTNLAIILKPKWRTADGDTLLQLVCQSEVCLSRISSAVLLKWLHSTTLHRLNISVPDSKTADGDTLIQLVCQSETAVSRICSIVMSKWLRDTTVDVNLEEMIKPKWKTADGDTLLQLVCQLETIVLRISSAVLSKWLNDIAINVNDAAKILIPGWKTADGDTLLRLVCQSETIVSQISSAVLSKWLRSSVHDIDMAKFITPEWKTADDDTLLQLVCQSKTILSGMSSAVICKWLHTTTFSHENIPSPDSKTADGNSLLEVVCKSKITMSQISSVVLTRWLKVTHISDIYLEIIVKPDWKTANGDTLLQLVCESKRCLSRISSRVLLEWLRITTLHHVNRSLPDCKTYNRDTLLQLACQSETTLSRISSAVLSKWLRDTTSNIDDIAKVLKPGWKTADGDTLLQLVCQSETALSQISSAVLSKWLATILDIDIAKFITPEWKTADNDTLFQLVCQSETAISQIYSAELSKWLKDTVYVNFAKLLQPNWKTADGDSLLQLVCQCEICLSRISTAVLFEWLHITTLHYVNVSLPDSKTADGDTLLQLVCQSQTAVSQISSAVLLKWLDDTTLDLTIVVIPNMKTADGDTLLQLLCQSETLLSRIPSVVLSKWLRNRNIHLNFVCVSPCCKTADNDTLFQLVLHSAMRISQISSTLLSKWLSDGREITAKRLKKVNPDWKTLDGDHFFHVLCQSRIDDKTLIELMQYYIIEYGLNPDILDSNDNTALHIACQTDRPAVVLFLTGKAHCNPNLKNKMENLPLDMTTNPKVIDYLCKHDQIAIFSKTVERWMKNGSIDNQSLLHILQVLVDNNRYETKDGSTLLHHIILYNSISVFRDKVGLLNHVLTEGHCDPNCLDSKGQMPLQLTTNSKIMQMLIEHGAKMTTDVVFKVISLKCITDARASELLTLSTRKGTMLWNPNEVNSDGDTALHLACKLGKPAIVKCLLAEAKCDPNANYNPLILSPLESTTSLDIAKILIKYGAKVTPKLVLRLEAMEEDFLNKIVLIELMLTTWNPDDRDGDGYTALHLACKAGNPARVNLLLSIAHCDPNFKSISEEVPLQMTANPEIIKDLIRHGAKSSIMYESYQESLGTNKPLQPPVKVFIVGNPSVGKSTLTAALKKKIGLIARIFSGKISNVDKNTVGIVPHDIKSDIFGRVTLYDFAGHREFYSGHAALLQTAIQSTPPIFLLVVNLCEDEAIIIKTILYWISFLENQCASVSCKPHIIIIGSHADTLKGINPKDKIDTIVDSLDTNCFTNMEYTGFVAMNCQYHVSAGMSDLRRLLIKSCEKLRLQEPITFNAHCFLVFLIDTFMKVSAVTIKTITEQIKNHQLMEGVLEFLPKHVEALYRICLELNDRGHILLLKDRIAAENSYIVIDKEFLLSKISGTVFAPEDFRQHKELSTNTGVVPMSKMAECFPDKDLDILMGFLTHLEFCHEIFDQALHQLISEEYSNVHVSGERYYFFPGLISLKADETVWQMQPNYKYNFGWILKCIHPEQFISSRFLHVLLLRLAFSFALEISCDNVNQSIGIHRNCYIWKNGIFWGSTFAMQTLVEVTQDNKSIILLARFQEDDLLQCVQHRSEVISTILQCKEQFCPRIQTTELFLGFLFTSSVSVKSSK